MGLLKNILTVGVMRVVLTLLIFLSDLVASRYLGVALKGNFFFLASSILLIGNLLTGGMHLGNIYYVKRIPFTELATNTLIYLAGVAVIVIGVGFPLTAKVPVLAAGGVGLKAIFVFCLVLETACGIFVNFFVGLGQLTQYAQIRILRRGLFLLLLAGAWMIWTASLELTLLFYLVTSLIALAAMGYMLPWQASQLRCRWSSLGKCLAYGLRSQAMVSVDMGTQRINAIFLGFWASPANNGIFSVALNFGQSLWLLASVLGIVIQAGVTNSPEEQLTHLEKLCRHAILLVALGAVALGLIATPLIRLLYGPAFEGAAPLLRIMLPGFVAYSLYCLLGNFMIVNGRAGTALWASLSGLLVTVCIGVFFIPTRAGAGAAWALSWGYLTATLIMVVVVSLLFKVQIRSLLILQKSDITRIGRKLKKIYSLTPFKA